MTEALVVRDTECQSTYCCVFFSSLENSWMFPLLNSMRKMKLLKGQDTANLANPHSNFSATMQDTISWTPTYNIKIGQASIKNRNLSYHILVQRCHRVAQMRKMRFWWIPLETCTDGQLAKIQQLINWLKASWRHLVIQLVPTVCMLGQWHHLVNVVVLAMLWACLGREHNQAPAGEFLSCLWGVLRYRLFVDLSWSLC